MSLQLVTYYFSFWRCGGCPREAGLRAEPMGQSASAAAWPALSLRPVRSAAYPDR